jgi:peptide deformylase
MLRRFTAAGGLVAISWRASSSSSTAHGTSHSTHEALKQEAMKFPIVAFPARSFFECQQKVDMTELRRGVPNDLIKQIKETRKFYQYPSLSAPKIGWNAQVFVLFDETVFINPEILVGKIGGGNTMTALTTKDQVWNFKGDPSDPLVKMCWTWEPTASMPFLMSYVKRPNRVTIRALNEQGDVFTVQLDKMRARMALHEMDHMLGLPFARRIPNADHAVPLDAFATVSQWADDWPSLEARSTFLYNIFTPPVTFETDPSVKDADFMTRKFEMRVYPGVEMEGIVVPPSSEDERNHYAQLWKRTKEDLADFSTDTSGSSASFGKESDQKEPRSPTAGADRPDGPLKRAARLKEMAEEVAQEADMEAASAEPAF